MLRRRDSTRIVFEILYLSQRGASRTHIVYRANINFLLAQTYINFLIRRGSLRERPKIRGTAAFEVTDKGQRFLRLLADVEKEMNHLFLNPREKPYYPAKGRP